MRPGLDLYYADPAQSLTAAGDELDHLDHELSELCKVLRLAKSTRFLLAGHPYTLHKVHLKLLQQRPKLNA